MWYPFLFRAKFSLVQYYQNNVQGICISSQIFQKSNNQIVEINNLTVELFTKMCIYTLNLKCIFHNIMLKK